MTSVAALPIPGARVVVTGAASGIGAALAGVAQPGSQDPQAWELARLDEPAAAAARGHHSGRR
ncbi:MAG: hypothetical protein M3Y77_18405 [Actinomycetota bacterium]|nr:hypothetical protein [Actinomycetota bacterium]